MPILRLDGDARGAVKATADVNAEGKKLAVTFKEVSDETDKAGQSHSRSFGGHALSELASYAAGMLTVHKAIELVTEALKHQAEEKKRAAENVMGGLSGAGTVANVSQSQGDFDRNVTFARRMMDDVIFKRSEQDSAMRAAAGVAASGATGGDRDFLIQLGKQKRIGGSEIGEFSQNVTRFREAFGPEAGSFQDVAKEFIRAGSDTLGVTGPDDIGRQAADIAEAARENGISPTRALAIYTTFARTTKSARRAGQLTRDFIDGKTDFSKEQKATYASELTSIQKAPGSRISDFIAGDARLGAARGAEEAEGARTGQFEDMTAERESLFERIESRGRAADYQRHGVGFSGALIDYANRLGHTLNRITSGEDATIRTAANASAEQQAAMGLTSDDVKEMKEYLRRQTEVMESINRQPPAPNGRQE